MISPTSSTREFPSWRNVSGRVVVVAFVAGSLTACGGMKSQITDAINENIGQVKACYSMQEKKAPTWPLRLRRAPSVLSESGLDPILAAMQASGYLRVTQEKERQGFLEVTVDVIAPTEEAKGWWSVENGYCVGSKTVAEVKEWTEPGQASGAPIQVTYTWRLADVPSWARRTEFKSIPGMATPVEAMALLQKTNKGWKALL